MGSENDASPWSSPKSALDEISPRHCPNSDCPERSAGRAAEYRGDLEDCPSCGSPLAEGPAPVVESEKPVQAGAPPWRRALITAAVLGLLYWFNALPLPGQMADGLILETNLAAMLTFSEVGLSAIISAFVVVELAAVLVPRWRALRIGGPQGRRRLTAAAFGLSVFLAAVHAGIIMNVAARAAEVRFVQSAMFLAIGCMTLGCLVVWAAVWVIDRWGFGSGFSVVMLLAGGFLLWNEQAMRQAEAHAMRNSDGAPLAIVCQILAVLLTYLVLRRPIPALQGPLKNSALCSPACGMIPFSVGSNLLGTVAGVTTAAASHGQINTSLELGSVNYTLFIGGLTVVLSFFFSWLFNQPKRIAQLRAFPRTTPSSAIVQAAHAEWLHAAKLSAVYLALIACIYSITKIWPGITAVDATTIAVVTAILLDLIDEWRDHCRTPDLVSVWRLHRVYALQPVLQSLNEANISATAKGLNHRTMLQFIGPYVPIDILVSRVDASRAEELLKQRFAHPPSASTA